MKKLIAVALLLVMTAQVSYVKKAFEGGLAVEVVYFNDGAPVHRQEYTISSAQSALEYFKETAIPAEKARVAELSDYKAPPERESDSGLGIEKGDWL